MTREFIITKEFDKQWELLGLDDMELSNLQTFLCEHSDFGDVMQGTGGVRKIRWAVQGRGKSGGARVIYLDVVFANHIYLITAFPKNVKTNLNKEERNQMKNITDTIKQFELENLKNGK